MVWDPLLRWWHLQNAAHLCLAEPFDAERLECSRAWQLGHIASKCKFKSATVWAVFNATSLLFFQLIEVVYPQSFHPDLAVLDNFYFYNQWPKEELAIYELLRKILGDIFRQDLDWIDLTELPMLLEPSDNEHARKRVSGWSLLRQFSPCAFRITDRERASKRLLYTPYREWRSQVGADRYGQAMFNVRSLLGDFYVYVRPRFADLTNGL